uniref:Putative structural protein n=1 Tax=viral metagenome TaxID=1070528 RepID=A0A6M3M283_9ZZZZ
MPEMGFQKVVRVRVMTTTLRDALEAVEGMVIFNSTTDQLEEYDGTTWQAVGQVILTTHEAVVDAHHTNLADITFIIDGGGSAITTGEKGHLEIPFACTIQRVTMEADQSGSIVVDIWKDTYANFPPTNAESITASAPPTITSAQKSQDATLTGWTTAIAAGDILAFNVDSITTITRVTISLKVAKS